MLDLARTIATILRRQTETAAPIQEATGRASKRVATLLSIAALFSSSMIVAADVAGATSTDFQIPAASLADALSKFGSQSGMQVVYAPDLARGLKAEALTGRLTVEAALKQLLKGTGLTWGYVNGNTVVLKRANAEAATAKKNSDAPDSTVALEEIVVRGIPEILVYGRRSINTDIERTEDDSQPYVIYDRETIEQSGATSVENFLRQRLPMNTAAFSNTQVNSALGTSGTVNLRGLGSNQTLILVDGHRIAEHYQQGSPSQSDVNGIPMSAIERIEVLPTTASGIYGGGATGGVINIILKRNYTGLEVLAGYQNTFDADAATRRIDMSGGVSFNDGKTSLSFAGSYLDNDRLHVGDRDFVQRSRERIVANNPAAIYPPFVPPLGATTNIRSAVNGVNLTLRDGTPLNSQFTHVPVGYTGVASDNGRGLLANGGRYNLDLAPTTQANGAQQSLLHDPTTKSLMVTVRQELHPRVRAFLEAARNESNTAYENSNFPAGQGLLIPSTAPNNPFQQNIIVTVPVNTEDFVSTTSSQDERLVGGVIVQLPRKWTMGADYVWSRSEYSFVSLAGLTAAGTAAIANGTLDVLRDTIAYPLVLTDAHIAAQGYQTPMITTLKDATLRFAGPIGMLPGGAPTLAMSFQHRDQDYSDGMQSAPSANVSVYFPSRSQSVDNVYAEIRVPIVSVLNRLPGIDELELQIAGRRDEYTVNGVTGNIANPNTPILRNTTKSSSTNPMLGLRWQANEDVMLRASYGTGFLPPTVNQVLPTVGSVSQTILDPLRGGTPTVLLPSQWLSGGNPNLKPEESTSRSAGLVLTPRIVPGLRISVDYTSIDKTDNILTMALQTAVDNETFLPGRIQRGPNLPGDPVGWAGPIVFADASLANLSRAEVEAYDVALDYKLRTQAFGTFDFFALGTWQPHYKTQVTPGAPMVENAGVSYSFPVEFKANAGVTWTGNAWSLGWSMQYLDSYRVEIPTATPYASTVRTQGSREVSSQAYHDLFASYQFGPGFMSGAELQVGIRNVFNKEPPFDARSTFSYYYSPFGDVRMASYRLALKWTF